MEKSESICIVSADGVLEGDLGGKVWGNVRD